MRRFALTLILLYQHSAHADAMFTGLGMPSDEVSSAAAAVSSDGAVIAGEVASGGVGTDETARWSGGAIELLGFIPGTSSSFATSISDDGQTIVGRSGTQAYRWHGGTMTGLGTLPGATGSTGWGVSADGSVVVGASGGGVLPEQQAFRWTQGTGMLGLGDLPGGITLSDARGVSVDGSIVVGASFSTNGQEAFRWTQGTGMIGLGDLAGGTFDSRAAAISANGVWIVGRGRAASGAEAMRWSDATGMLPLGVVPGSGASEATDVSGDGSIIVGTSNNVAFIWDEAHGMRDLKQVLEQDFALDLTDWFLTTASGVSVDGQTIVGTGVDPQGHTEGWIAVIPEPSTGLLFGAGLVVLAAGRRLRT